VTATRRGLHAHRRGRPSSCSRPRSRRPGPSGRRGALRPRLALEPRRRRSARVPMRSWAWAVASRASRSATANRWLGSAGRRWSLRSSHTRPRASTRLATGAVDTCVVAGGSPLRPRASHSTAAVASARRTRRSSCLASTTRATSTWSATSSAGARSVLESVLGPEAHFVAIPPAFPLIVDGALFPRQARDSRLRLYRWGRLAYSRLSRLGTSFHHQFCIHVRVGRDENQNWHGHGGSMPRGRPCEGFPAQRD